MYNNVIRSHVYHVYSSQPPHRAVLAAAAASLAAMNRRKDERRWDRHMDQRGSRQYANQSTMASIITLDEFKCSIFQGGWIAAHDLNLMRRQNMGLIINVTTNVPSQLGLGRLTPQRTWSSPCLAGGSVMHCSAGRPWVSWNISC